MQTKNKHIMQKKKDRSFLTRQQYDGLVNRANRFATILLGDCGFANPQVNRVALESMLVGWMTSQAYWKRYSEYCGCHHPRENIFLMAQDQALQAAQDAVGYHPRFKA